MTTSYLWVAGPSGAGKDTLLRLAAQQLQDDTRFHFVTRLVTRPQGAWKEKSLTVETLAALERAGELALRWQAHGWDYALPWLELQTAARLQVASVSRQVLPQVYAELGGEILLIDAELEIRRQRLLARGREAPAAVAVRLERQVLLPAALPYRCIRNDGALADGVQSLLERLQTLVS
ncbi:MAG: PhnN protein [Candidatus Igneacidithiobacillus chanchocoensis]